MTLGFALLTLTVACFFVKTRSLEYIYPDNGWRPMSIEKVLGLQRNFIKTTNVESQDLRYSHKKPMDNSESENFVQIEANKKYIEDKVLVVPKYDKQNYRGYPEFIKIIEPPYKETITFDDKGFNWEMKNNPTLNQVLRKAKKIDNFDTVENLSSSIGNPTRGNDRNQSDEIKKNNDKTRLNKTYEVKENIYDDDQLASDQKLLDDKDIKYELSKPKATNQNNNFTANLLSILANYNIRTGDKLSNYATSLRQNSRQTQNQDIVYMHVPIKVPLGYNNANHLPVDPFLAVFLSNFGHYLPRLYGFHTGYNNLYGYSASNNIHNNRPFGSYKIFSDSDSFH